MNTLEKWNPFAARSWDPFKDLEQFENRLGTLFGRLPAKTNGEAQESITVPEWAPVVDITEDEKEFLVKAELPGLKKEEIKISVEDGVLTISGERKVEKEEKNKKYHRIERAYGRFERSFTLPDQAEAAKVNAEFNDGVLQVHLPKSPKAAPKAQEIKIS